MMRLNDATPADWDRVRKQHPAIEIKTGLEAWMKAAHDEDSELWGEEEAAHSSWDNEVEDVVNNPDHYNSGNIECIDAIEESMSSHAFKGYLKGNCMKYLWRYDYKGKQVEDLQKAGWYLRKLTAMVTEENT
jgi:hypothetical protein